MLIANGQHRMVQHNFTLVNDSNPNKTRKPRPLVSGKNKIPVMILNMMLLVLLLSACNRTLKQNNPTKNIKVGRDKYQVVFTSEGSASYYAQKFHGRPTASGEIYDSNLMTAAHRDFPFGTLVRVTNLTNQKSVIVKVNDRGPYTKNRIIDLSLAAAEQLDFIQQGVITVRVEQLRSIEYSSK